VARVEVERRPTSGIDGGRRRLPRQLGGNGEEGAGLDNTQPREVHWGLGKPGEWLAGGEREQVHELKAAAAMAGGAARMARRGEEDSA
jgi:hypothetical protein